MLKRLGGLVLLVRVLPTGAEGPGLQTQLEQVFKPLSVHLAVIRYKTLFTAGVGGRWGW